MGKRLYSIEKPQFDAQQAELEAIGRRLAELANEMGPCFGTACSRRGIKVYQAVLAYKQFAADLYEDQTRPRPLRLVQQEPREDW